jgi:hypothetical protein
MRLRHLLLSHEEIGAKAHPEWLNPTLERIPVKIAPNSSKGLEPESFKLLSNTFPLPGYRVEKISPFHMEWVPDFRVIEAPKGRVLFYIEVKDYNSNSTLDTHMKRAFAVLSYYFHKDPHPSVVIFPDGTRVNEKYFEFFSQIRSQIIQKKSVHLLAAPCKNCGSNFWDPLPPSDTPSAVQATHHEKLGGTSSCPLDGL